MAPHIKHTLLAKQEQVVRITFISLGELSPSTLVTTMGGGTNQRQHACGDRSGIFPKEDLGFPTQKKKSSTFSVFITQPAINRVCICASTQQTQRVGHRRTRDSATLLKVYLLYVTTAHTRAQLTPYSLLILVPLYFYPFLVNISNLSVCISIFFP